MKQVVHDQSGGEVSVLEVPAPILLPQGVLVSTLFSVISSGTERSKVSMGDKSLIGKARARPDLAKKVIDQARKDGIRSTVELVRDRLGTPQPLGYSSVGRVLEVGDQAVSLRPGQLVACAGAGFANHAEVVYVPALLTAPVPEGVSLMEAAFATLGSIALHGIRQAELTQGELVVVSGLGLVGQVTVRILRAYGHPIVGVDPDGTARAEVEALGVAVEEPGSPQLAQLGADAALLTAATSSDDPIRRAPAWLRDRGRVVVVGDVGLHLDRPPYYDREVDLRFSRSYGPGRYDPEYEDRGRDYPIGYVRWTEGRNLAEFLRLLADGRLEVADLVDEVFPFDRAAEAYARLSAPVRTRALVLDYGNPPRPAAAASRPALRPRHNGQLNVSVCGAGNFARKTLLPAFDDTGKVRWAYIATASGLTAQHLATQRSFEGAVATSEEAIVDAAVDAALIATRHDSHAALAALAAERGLPAYVEKPLAINEDQLAAIEQHEGAAMLTVGFNRRASTPGIEGAAQLARRRAPAVITMRINAGRLPSAHWADTAEQGGRLIGECCHFVDLACHLLGSPVTRVTAAGSGQRDPLLEDTFQLLLHHGDGSHTTIAYFANGSADLPKERIEAHWDEQSLIIDDFLQWHVSDSRGTRRHRSRGQDKGHAALVRRFVDFAAGDGENPVPFHQAAHVTRVTFAAVASLRDGDWKRLEPPAW